MERATNPDVRHRWKVALEKVPLPIRLLFAAWIFLSLAFNLGSPSSTANLPPPVRFIVLLPMAIVSFGLSVFVLWNGGRTLFRASKSILAIVPERDGHQRSTLNFIGGVGAMNIYMIVYSLIAFGSIKPFGSYAVGMGLSCILCAGLAFLLFKRGPHPKDVKIFLWGSLGVTALFGIIMATVAAPPA